MKRDAFTLPKRWPVGVAGAAAASFIINYFTGTDWPHLVAFSALAAAGAFVALFLSQSATQIFLPNQRADRKDYIDGFKVTEAEFEIIRTLGEDSRQFLVKQNTPTEGCISLSKIAKRASGEERA